ncbi:MAG: prenyltransferase/squalene oxidase repeat-containing protein [Rhodanobacteraceae bacterium]
MNESTRSTIPEISGPVSGLPPALSVKARMAAVRARSYLEGRQSSNGGFCFYRWQAVDEPTLRDTWHAVAALTLLGAGVPRRDEIVAFLLGFPCTGFDDRYHRTMALARLNESIPTDAIERIGELDAAAVLVDTQIPVAARLQRASQIVALQRGLAAVHAPAVVIERTFDLCRDGGWGDKPSLPETWHALAILDACGSRSHGDDVNEFIDALQVPSFGFTATRDSTFAPLEVVHAGLRACSLLRLPVRHLSDAVASVLACQSDDGGFARTSDALPGIALTHLGLLALAFAGALSVPAAPGWRDDSGT